MIGGLGLCLTIVGVRLASSPSSSLRGARPSARRSATRRTRTARCASSSSLIWLVLFGLGDRARAPQLALLLAVTIIGIPFALQHLKMVPLALSFGRELR